MGHEVQPGLVRGRRSGIIPIGIRALFVVHHGGCYSGAGASKTVLSTSARQSCCCFSKRLSQSYILRNSNRWFSNCFSKGFSKSPRGLVDYHGVVNWFSKPLHVLIHYML